MILQGVKKIMDRYLEDHSVHYHKQFLHKEQETQSNYSVKNAGYLTRFRFQILVHNINKNQTYFNKN